MNGYYHVKLAEVRTMKFLSSAANSIIKARAAALTNKNPTSTWVSGKSISTEEYDVQSFLLDIKEETIKNVDDDTSLLKCFGTRGLLWKYFQRCKNIAG